MAQGLAFLASFGILAYLFYDEYRVRFRMGRRQKARATPEWATYPLRVYIPLFLGLLLALIYRASLISPFFVLVGFAITYHLSRRLYIAKRLQTDQQVLQLVLAFRGIFKVRPAVFAALEEARKKTPEPLRTNVAAAVQAFYVTSSPKKAYAELGRRVPNPYLDQFLFILDRSETASRDVVYAAIDNLVARMRRHEDLRAKSEVNLAAITGQTTFIQVLSILIIFAIGLTRLRNFYVNSVPTQMLFITFVTVALLTSWYIDARTQAIKEKVL